MWHATWNRILAARGRLVLTVVAVAIGVTFLTVSLVLADSTRAALDDSYAQVYAGVDLVVRGPESVGESPFANGASPLPASTAERIEGTPGVAEVEGRISSVAQLSIPGAGDPGEAAIAMAVPGDAADAAIDLRSGRLPARSGQVAVDAAAAEALELTTGERVAVLLPQGTVQTAVSGIVGFGRLDGLAGGARVLFDPQTAAERFGGSGYAEVVVRLEQGASPQEVSGHIAALGEETQILTATEAAARDAAAASAQTALVSRIVLAVAVVALLIGGFLIANTFRMLVGQRARELALLRAVGASRRQVASSVLAEASITGGIGSLLGVALGLGAGVLLVSVSAGLMPGLPPASPTITPTPIVAGLLVGISVAALAGRSAARRAMRVPPIAAMRMVSAPETGPSHRRLLLGTLLFAGSVAAVLLAVGNGAQPVLIGGSLTLLLAVGVLFPAVTGPLLALLSRPLDHLGVSSSLARQQTLAAPRRAGATAAALAVSLGLITFLLVLNASLGASTGNLLAQRQHADFTIRSTARQGLHDSLFAVAEDLRELPGVATAQVVTYGDARITDPASDETRPRTVSLYIVDPTAVDDLFDVRNRAGDVGDLGAGDIAVRDTLAAANGWRQGQQLSAEFPDGSTAAVTVSALFDGAVGADWIAAPATAEPHQPNAYREAFVRLADGVSIAEAQPALQQVVDDAPSVSLLSRDEQALETADANESSLGILTALFALSLPIGILGVVNTLSLAVIERTRELGLLRAVGATRGQVRAMIRWEALLTSTLGALVGATLGLSLAWIATTAIPDQTLPLTVPAVHVGIAIAVTALLGVTASLLPAVRASRLDVLHALQTP